MLYNLLGFDDYILDRNELLRLLGEDVSKENQCELPPGIEPEVNIGREERIARAGRVHGTRTENCPI